MNTTSPLVLEILGLCSQYREESVLLATLASRSETLVEQMRSELSSEDFLHAMNRVYLIEEINALCLDENRNPTREEKNAIFADLDALERIFIQKSKDTKQPPAEAGGF